MKFIEVKENLFNTENYTTDRNVVLAHCIASDLGMYGGIATQFICNYDMKTKLKKQLRVSMSKDKPIPAIIGTAVKVDNVYNLITKPSTADSPLMADLINSLKDMKSQMTRAGEHTLAIPDMIGCGIDGLDRDSVVAVIKCVFLYTDITIYAVKL